MTSARVNNCVRLSAKFVYTNNEYSTACYRPTTWLIAVTKTIGYTLNNNYRSYQQQLKSKFGFFLRCLSEVFVSGINGMKSLNIIEVSRTRFMTARTDRIFSAL